MTPAAWTAPRSVPACVPAPAGQGAAAAATGMERPRRWIPCIHKVRRRSLGSSVHTGLRDGDIVAIRSNPDPNNGEMVVGRVDDEVTLKRFVRLDPEQVELRPESSNPEHKPIRIDLAREQLHIDGVAVGALIGKR